MKKLIIGLFIAGVVAAESVVAAQSIAFVDAEAAILSSERAKEKVAELKNRYAPEQTAIKDLAEGIKKLQAKVQQDAAVMSESEKRKLAQELETKAVEYQKRVQQLKQSQQQSQQELMAELGPKFEQAVKEIISEGDYNILMHRKAAIFVDPKDDITRRVTEKLNVNQ